MLDGLMSRCTEKNKQFDFAMLFDVLLYSSPGHDLDLRSNFIFDFSGSYYTSFDAS